MDSPEPDTPKRSKVLGIYSYCEYAGLEYSRDEIFDFVGISHDQGNEVLESGRPRTGRSKPTTSKKQEGNKKPRKVFELDPDDIYPHIEGAEARKHLTPCQRLLHASGSRDVKVSDQTIRRSLARHNMQIRVLGRRQAKRRRMEAMSSACHGLEAYMEQVCSESTGGS